MFAKHAQLLNFNNLLYCISVNKNIKLTLNIPITGCQTSTRQKCGRKRTSTERIYAASYRVQEEQTQSG